MRSLAEVQEDFLSALLQKSEPTNEEAIAADRYRRLVATNHRNALRDTYPVIFALVGERYFSQLAWRYLVECPPSDSDLNRYGDTFSSFLEKLLSTNSELENLPYLPALAEFEWAMYIASFGSTSVLQVSYTVQDIWSWHHQGSVEELPLEERAQWIVVWKQAESHEVCFREVEAAVAAELLTKSVTE